MPDFSRILSRLNFHIYQLKPVFKRLGSALLIFIGIYVFYLFDILMPDKVAPGNGGLFYMFSRASFDPSDAEGFYCTVKIVLTILVFVVIIRLKPILQDIIGRMQ